MRFKRGKPAEIQMMHNCNIEATEKHTACNAHMWALKYKILILDSYNIIRNHIQPKDGYATK